jgi:hypothetical protein
MNAEISLPSNGDPPWYFSNKALRYSNSRYY